MESPNSPQSTQSVESGGRSRSSSNSSKDRSRSVSPAGSSPAPARDEEPEVEEDDGGTLKEKSRSRSVSRSPVASKSSRSGSGSSSAGSPSRNDSPAGSKSSRSRSGSPDMVVDESPQRALKEKKESFGEQTHSDGSGTSSGNSDSEAEIKTKVTKTRKKSSTDGSRSVSPAGSASPSKVGTTEVGRKSKEKSRSRSVSRSPHGSKSSRSGSHSSSGGSKSRSASPAGSKSSRSRSGSPETVVSEKIDKEKSNEAEASTPKKASEFFGDADDLSSSSSEKSDSEPETRREKVEEKWVDDRIKSDEEDDREQYQQVLPKKPEVEEPEEIPETRIDVDIPKITTDLGKGIHFVKLPNFLSVETRPFDPNTYEDEIDEEETLDEEGRARLKLKVENTIRWRERFNDKGVFVKESNARFVKWSDGSLSLHLGDEIFNVYKQPLQGDHNHLFIRQGTGLQGQAVFRTKLTFRPHSTESFTHRKMTMSLADRSSKTSGIKVLSSVGLDPEQHRDELIKKEEDRLRASVKRESKRRRVRERVSSRGLSSAYLDDDMSDDENAISIRAIKDKYKKSGPGKAQNIYSSDEEEEDAAIVDDEDDESDLEPTRKSDKPKRIIDSDDDEDEEAEVKEPDSQGAETPMDVDKDE